MPKKDFELRYDIDEISRISKHVKFVPRREKFPEGFTFAVVYIIEIGKKEMDIARIDNYPHEGKVGTHIHRYKVDYVEFRNLSIGEAEKLVIKIGEEIKFKYFRGE